jgi:outer membrane protein assembly factor BamB
VRKLFHRLLLLVLGISAAHSAEDWPQFRGPRGDGSSTATNVPVSWSEASGVLWKAEIPGRGRSSPVVLDHRIWATTALEQGTKRTRIGPDDMQTAEHVTLKAVCLDREDGRIRWEAMLFEVANPAPAHWFNSWATPTPVVESGRLYCDFGTYGTACLDAEIGSVLWTQRLPVDHQVGPGSSPVLWRNLLILVRDGRDAQYVAAVDKQTGQVVWKVPRPSINSGVGDLKKSFVTPLIVDKHGQTQVIAPGAHWVVSYDPATGKERWRARHGTGFSIGSCPVADEDLVFFSTGCFKAQLWAMRFDGEGEVGEAQVAWKSLRQVPVMSSPVLVRDELFYVSDDGMATCCDKRTGQPHWQERLGGSYLASPVAADGRVYFFCQDGKTTVVKASRQFEKLAENTLKGPLVATPAVLDGSLIIRTDNLIYRITAR